jgi:hypothetical protein
MMELRCSGNKLHGILVTECSGLLEVRCDSVFCGKASGIVVLHRFDLSTGDYHTERYSVPTQSIGGEVNGS